MAENNQPPQDEALDPNFSPDTVNKSGTRRVNNRPLLLAGTGLMLFAVTIGFVASQRGQHPDKQGKTNHDAVKSSAMAAQEIIGNRSGVIPENKPKPTPPQAPNQPSTPDTPTGASLLTKNDGVQAPAIPIERPLDPEAPPPPPREEASSAEGSNLDDAVTQQAEQKMAQAKLQQFEEALKGHTTVSVSMPRSEGSRPSHEQVASNDDTQSKLAALRHKMDNDDAESDEDTDARKTNQSDNDTRNSLSQFDSKENKNRWKLESKVEKPESRYLLRSGFVMPATLISGINSELPGQISAQISQNVYDTATGRYLLIPQGSRLMGEYNSQITYGQNRVLVAWQRVIFPDGKALDIGAMPGTDFAGYSGFKDQVDNHFLRVFGSALLMSGITAGVNYSQNQTQGNSNGYNMNSSSVLSQSLGEGMGEAMRQLFQRNMNIAPTLKIRPGYRLNVMVNKDLVFSKPYENFDY